VHKHRAAGAASDLIHCRPNNAVLVTLETNLGIVTDGPFGIVELTCWRMTESMVKSYGKTHTTGSPPLPRIPVHDKDGNIIADPKE